MRLLIVVLVGSHVAIAQPVLFATDTYAAIEQNAGDESEVLDGESHAQEHADRDEEDAVEDVPERRGLGLNLLATSLGDLPAHIPSRLETPLDLGSISISEPTLRIFNSSFPFNAMLSECSSFSKLSKFMPNHIFSYIYRYMFLTIMNCNRMTNQFWINH